MKHYCILFCALTITFSNPGDIITFIVNSNKKLMLTNAEMSTVKFVSKNNNNDKYKINVFVIGVIMALIIIPIFLFFVFLYINDPINPASIPFTRHVITVMMGCFANIIAPLGSAPTTTIKETMIPNTKPRKDPIHGPNVAPPTIIGINVNVIGKLPKLIYVDNSCRTIIMPANMLITAIFLVFTSLLYTKRMFHVKHPKY